VQHPHSRLIPPTPAIPAQPVYSVTPPCTHCASADTEPLAMMRLHTCDTDEWVRCNACGHTFTALRWPQV
jgi:hypothetical protein